MIFFPEKCSFVVSISMPCTTCSLAGDILPTKLSLVGKGSHLKIRVTEVAEGCTSDVGKELDAQV